MSKLYFHGGRQKRRRQAGAELGQAQVRLKVIVKILFEVEVDIVAEVGVQPLARVGGG